ncbi:hypothetical protein E4U43_003594 [Claviceps pusilla]|uniref:FAS1 domain-containing protein n=1 Tax=Claviceps pusilla TaxID=123648 RepID=A0A9P7SXG4_9HYPO|nr:hypothetical protein E4U43_003594 [Claviceps pusilla]
MSGPDRQSPPVVEAPVEAHPATTIPKIKTRSPSSPQTSPHHTTPPAQDRYAPKPQTSVSLADTIGPHRSISSFSSFTRVNPATAHLLDDLAAKMTLLAPLNSAIDALPRKPWEEPEPTPPPPDQDPDQTSQEGQQAQDRAKHNLDRFVRAHIVLGMAPWKEGTKAETLAGGGQIWWEEREDDGVRVVYPDGMEVERVAARVANGELWILRGVLNFK